jgi:hypothetical protein
MDIIISWQDLVKLAANGTLQKDGNKLIVGPAVLPHLSISADGLTGFVQFNADESDPRLLNKS